VKYPSQVCWRENSHKQHEGQECGNGNGGNGCDAEVTVCATNRLAGPRDRAKVNFTFEVGSSLQEKHTIGTCYPSPSLFLNVSRPLALCPP